MRAQTKPLAVAVVVTVLPDALCRLSGGVIFIVVQVIVEGDDGADEFSQLHKVSCDNVDATLPGSLRSDPLHHAR